MRVRIIGGGLAGSECAWQLAEAGHEIELVEMRPTRSTEAHKTGKLAELVCSNSFRSMNPTNAVGLLKEEMTRMGSFILGAAERSRVPAGDAFAVDRERLSDLVTSAIENHPSITLVRDEAGNLDREGAEILVVATGPLTSSSLHASIDDFLGNDGLYFYDAIAPILALDSLDLSKMYWKSRYDKGDGKDYLNAPMTREQYEAWIEAVLSADLHQIHDFDEAAHFEGCLPVEEIAIRGIDTLRWGPMKPVGLEHPETGERPWAVVQLRKEDLSDEYVNIVGFQTKMKIPEQKRVLRMIPGLENARFARYGSMHRNTFINGPRHLSETFQTRRDPKIFFAGQITGVEGYVESTATGLLVARYIDEISREGEATALPFHTALGGLGRHVSRSKEENYQPSNITWALIENVSKVKKKKERRHDQVRIALETIERLSTTPKLAAAD